MSNWLSKLGLKPETFTKNRLKNASLVLRLSKFSRRRSPPTPQNERGETPLAYSPPWRLTPLTSYHRHSMPPVLGYSGSGPVNSRDASSVLPYHTFSSCFLIQPAIAAMHGPHSLVRFGPGCAGRT